MAYLPKLNPKIGKGLPGLPSQSSEARGEITFTIPGTYTWDVPDNVWEICAVAVGGGGGGVCNMDNDDVASGGGGALAWVNRVPVYPGLAVTVYVGAGGEARNYATATVPSSNGANSYVSVNGVKVVHADGGGRGTIGGPNAAGGTVLVGTGGNGGAGAYKSGATEAFATGGGAGGYSGTGGAGVSSSTDLAGNAGAGGGGGSGGVDYAAGVSMRAGGSGGTGVFGEGTSGAAGDTNGSGGGGGSGGAAGGSPTIAGAGVSGIYGGGGSACNSNSASFGTFAMPGAHGAVRIIWGPGRAFPSTYVGAS